MIFACSIGSLGSDQESFSIYFPLEFCSGREFSLDDNKFYGRLDGREILVEQHHHLYSIKVSGFESKSDAEAYLEKLLASLRWVALKHNIGMKFPKDVKELLYYDESIEITEKSNFYELSKIAGWSTLDGYYNADDLSIIPEHHKLIRWENGKANIRLGLSPDVFIEGLEEGITFPNIENIINNNKLCTAVEIYSSYSFEVTNTGRFVKLVTVLESLLPELIISSDNQLILNEAKALMKSRRKELKKACKATETLDHLINRVRDLSKESIGKTIETFIKELIIEFPDLGSSDVIIPRLKSSYNVRSRLLHDGCASEEILVENIAFLSDLIPKLLRNLFLKYSQSSCRL